MGKEKHTRLHVKLPIDLYIALKVVTKMQKRTMENAINEGIKMYIRENRKDFDKAMENVLKVVE